ncbi:NmrA family NAD(P)-binding protein [Pengzhenrongella phosphoraccumulans]|uniref:NmrA family NAD(P)-binding protein n=1 Tax=Pengzhenrongella phosphoraccumulans TaxID=3114394 RepID=UPI0038906598
MEIDPTPTAARATPCPVLVTGATGNVGSAVLAELVAAGVPVRAAVRPGGRTVEGVDCVPLDLTDPSTWADAFAGVRTMFLVRPPALGNVKRDLLPALAAAREHGVAHVVFLSLQGAERNPVVPHATVEKWLRRSGLTWTFVRPSFFHQNLSTTHVSDIRDRDEIVIPAGRGRTAFVDVLDVAAVAAQALAHPDEHRNRAWTVTGPRAVTYAEVAQILSGELARPIRYARPGALGYMRHARRALRMPWAMVAVTLAIYTSARLGLAAGLSDDVRTVLRRDPIDFETFAHREAAIWTPRPA